MSDWKRTTREITFEELPGDLKSEIQKHIKLYTLGDILSDALICIQSDAEKPKKGLFGSAETNRIGVVLTPRWLIWAISGTKTSASVLSALLADVVVQDYADTPFAKMVSDSGIEVNGRFTDTTEAVSAFIGLQENDAGRKFKEVLIRAVQDAKK